MKPEAVELSRELAEELEIDRAQLIGLLRAYREARSDRDLYAKRVESIGKLFKDYLERHPDEVLYDGENRIEARLQARNGSESYDVTRMAPELVLRLQAAHCLAIDVKVLRALAGKDMLPEETKPYRMPGGITTALVVQEVRE